MYYVYILQSKKDASNYIGVTEDLKTRLKDHNQGKASYSKTKRPFNLIWYSAFISKKKAYAFEEYLKSSSGYAFRNKRLI
jgi:putative endonuclease